MSILLGILTVILIFVSIFIVLVVLAQKTKDGGMGAVLGGGAAEAAFGADTSNVLSKSTIYAAILFFVLAFSLYLGRIYERSHARSGANNALPSISAPALPPAAPAGTTTPAAGTTTPQAAITVPTTPAATPPAAGATAPTTPPPTPPAK